MDISCNEFNLDALRLPQNFSAAAAVKKVLTTIPVRKPGPQEFIRIHPDDEMCIQTAIIQTTDDRESFLVDRSLWEQLSSEIIPKVLFTTINRSNVLSLWPIRLPGEDGRLDPWNRSALEAAAMAKTRWIRITSNRSLGAYEIFEAAAELPEPEWPAISFQEILTIAFREKFIRSLDHPVLRRLRGEI